MQSVVNQEFLDKRGKYARWGSYIGFAALFIGLITALRQPLLSYLFLLIGLLAASFGSYMSNRYVREPRPDQRLAEAMENLDKRYVLYNYYLPSDHVVFSHHGFTVLEPRPHEGEVIYRDGRWKHKAGFRKILQFFGEPALGKPDQDLERQVEWVQEFVEQIPSEEEIAVHGAIVFTHPNVELDLEDLDIPAVKLDELPEFMKEGLRDQPFLSTSQRREIRSMLDDMVAQA